MDKKSKINTIFLGLSICCSLWAGGYAMMLTSDSIKIAFFWRAIASFGYCFFNGCWLYITFLFDNNDESEYSSIIKFLAFVPAILFSVGNIIVEPSASLTKENYGWIDVSPNLLIQIIYGIWALLMDVFGIVILFLRGKNSKKNRVKRQVRIILTTCIVSVGIGVITDFILPLVGIIIFPSSVLTGTIALGGVCYAISKHKMMLNTPKYISEYIFNTVNEPIFILSEDFAIHNCNEAALSITDYKLEELEGKFITELIDNESSNFNAEMKKGYVKNVEFNLLNKNGSYVACELSSTYIYDEYNDIPGIVILVHDISERKKIYEIEKKYTLELEEKNKILNDQINNRIRAEEQILHFVNYDILTDLPNRKMMREKLNRLLNNEKERFALLFIDLDGFKSINDNFGHRVGDEVLKHVSEILRKVINPSDMVCRIGGDEFIIILRNMKSNAYIKDMARSIQKAFKEPFIYNEELLVVGASIGISIAPEHGKDSDALINKADLAMYEVKKSGGYDYAIYSSKMSDKVINKLEMKKKLNEAMKNNEFVIYYQPIMDLKSMKVVACEALIRWKQGDRIISPAEFIPIAKSLGEMVSIDNWVLENACAQCKKWLELGINEVSISVNTSYSQLKQPEFVYVVQGILDIYSLPPNCLNIEITEDEAMEDLETIIVLLEQLNNIGVRVSLDDFGTGYSSLSHVNRLPIDILKIDRSLIMNLEGNYKSKMIAEAIIKMSHSLNVKIIAEGIENQEQLRILKELECDYIQGYLIGKPMEATDFEKVIFNSENSTSLS